jgi:hypothetical protein
VDHHIEAWVSKRLELNTAHYLLQYEIEIGIASYINVATRFLLAVTLKPQAFGPI